MAYDQVTQYNEDSAHTTGDKGMQILGVRNDSATALSGTNGDYTPMATDSAGRVGISDLGGTVSIDDGGGSLTVDGTVAVSGTVTVTATNLDVQSGGADLATSTQAAAIQTSVQLIDDAVQVLGTDTYTEATSKGITLGAVRRDADTALVNTTNEFTPLQTDARGFLKSEVFSGEILPVSLTSTTITGTVAVTQSGTWDEVGINDSGNSITIDNSTLAVVGGGTEAAAMRVTIASDSTGVLSIDDNGGSITVDGTVTATNPSVIVDDAAFTPASTSVTMVGATFDDTTPDSVNEGDGGAVRMSGNRNLYTTIRDAAGNERGVNVTASNAMTVDGSAVTQPVSAASLPLPTGASTSANQTTIIGHLDGVEGLLTTIDTDTGNIVTSVQLLDDVVATDGSAALTKLYQVGGTDGTNAQIMSTNASGHVNIADGGNSITVDGTVAATQSGTWVLGANSGVDIGDVTINNAAGASAVNIQDGGNSITVDGTVTVTGVATLAEQQTQTASLSVMDDWDNAASDGASVSGDVAHDAVDAGEPVKVGYKAIAHGTNPTAVAAADRTNGYANRAGIPFVIGGHPNIITFEAAYTAAQTDTAIVTIAGGLKIVVTEIEALCDTANTVNVACRVGFGATTTPTTTGVVLTHPGISAGSGVVRGNGGGILGVGADGEDLRITCTAPTTGSIRVLVSYYTIES